MQAGYENWEHDHKIYTFAQLLSKKRLERVQERSFFFDLRKEKGAQNPYPESAFAVNLLRWIVSILGSLSKLVEISASV